MLRKAFFVGLSMASLSAMTAFAVDQSRIPPILHISHFQDAAGCDAAKVMPKLRTGAPGVTGQEFADNQSCVKNCLAGWRQCRAPCISPQCGDQCDQQVEVCKKLCPP